MKKDNRIRPGIPNLIIKYEQPPKDVLKKNYFQGFINFEKSTHLEASFPVKHKKALLEIFLTGV